MEEKFINLKQWEKSVDAYAAEFLRLSRFAPYMVADEETKVKRFQQGLNLDMQMYMETQHFATYSHVLTAARGLERLQQKKNKVRPPQGQSFTTCSGTCSWVSSDEYGSGEGSDSRCDDRASNHSR